MAEEFRAAVGLDNVRLEVRDILDDRRALEEFDYIIAHGVYSWVPKPVQDALLGLCRDHLSPNGIALVDYNVAPGWHVRAFCAIWFNITSEAAARPKSPFKRLCALWIMLPAISSRQPPRSPNPWAICNVGLPVSPGTISPMNSATAIMRPCRSPILPNAPAPRLDILGDADITHVVPAAFAASVAAKLDQVAGDDYIQREQYIDFLRGRDFRRTLLMKQRPNIARPILPQALSRLHFTTMARLEASPQGPMFSCPDGAKLHTTNHGLFLALSALCKAGPQGLTFESLLQHAAPQMPVVSAESFGASLLEVVAGGVVQVHAHPPRATNDASEKPLASAVARAMARSGEVVTSLLQRDWRVDAFEKNLLRLLDGTRDRQNLASSLLQMIERGEIPPTDPSGNAQTLIQARITSSLHWFARVGLLLQ